MLERLWNKAHYFLYRADYRLGLWIVRISGLALLLKLPPIKRFYQKRQRDPLKEFDDFMLGDEVGSSDMWAGMHVHALIVVLCMGFVCLYIGAFRIRFTMSVWPFVVSGIVSIAVNYLFLFGRDKYLTYFKEFDKTRGADRRKLLLTGSEIVLGILLFGVASCAFMVYRL